MTPTPRPDLHGNDPRDEKHFHLLRIAQARRLHARHLGSGVYSVPSSRPDRRGPYRVDVAAGSCSCPAVGPCSHLALARHRWETEDRPDLDGFAYRGEEAESLLALRLRILRGETGKADREYVRHARATVPERQAVNAAMAEWWGA